MYSKSLSFLLIAVFVAVECTPIEYYDSGNANAFVDQLLKGVMAQYNKTIDPFHIEDKVASFSKKIGIITFHGDAKLTEGTITGLSHLFRSGDSSIGSEKGHFLAHLRFGDNNIKVHYKALAEFMDLKTHLTLEASIGNIDVELNVGADANGKPTLTDFKIDELKHVKLDVHGPIKPLDHLIDLLGEEFVKVLNPVAKNVLSKILKGIIGKEIQNLKLPTL